VDNNSDSDSNEDFDVDNELYLQLPNGAVSRAVADRDALIVMAGEGAVEWLSPVLGGALRAVPHALGRTGGAERRQQAWTRAWFGLMVLPPADALVPLGGGQRLVPYSEFRARELEAASALASEAELFYRGEGGRVRNFLPSACVTGLGSRSHDDAGDGDDSPTAVAAMPLKYKQKRMLTNALCSRTDGSSGVMCWTICQSVTELQCGMICFNCLMWSFELLRLF
jgi:hypothetical protein